MIETKVMVVTPEIAKEWLKRNEYNFRQKPNKNKVAQYAWDMKHDKWQLNGEAIVFDEDGNLKNGQNRLHAIIEAGLPVQMLVVKGVKRSVEIWDIGWNRSSAQILGNVKYKTTLVSIATLILSNFHRCIYTQNQVLDYIRRYDEILKDAAELVCSGNQIIRQSPVALAAYLHLYNGRIARETLCSFFAAASSGFESGDRDCTPAISLRNTIINDRRTGIQLVRWKLFASTLHAIDDFEHGKHRTKVYSDNPDIIPEFDRLRNSTMVFK